MTPSPSSPPSEPSLHEFALGKLTRVFGPERGRRVFEATLASVQMARLTTPDDLHAFAAALSLRGGFEAAVGGLLTVAATLRGASGASTRRM